ncbi:hypothetical protein ZTR_09646 [Talaromyces verruculosus]|nr:hypothetical protein ZTR_09646 [Talaromyces verruculosus]
MPHQSTRSSEDPSTDITQLVDASPITTPLPQPLASSSGLNGKYSKPEIRPSASSTKQKIHVRETSSSFLHFLRKTLRSYVGLMPFTDGDCHFIMLDADITPRGAAELEPSPEEMYSLLDSYFEASSGLLDLFTADEVDLLISNSVSSGQASSPSSMSEIDAASLYTALAIGAQVRPLGDPSSRIELDYFCRAQRVAFENILHNPANHEDLDSDEHNQRVKIWNSLRNIDILSSFILGKPRNLPTTLWQEKNDDAHMNFGSIFQYPQAAFSEIVKACSLLESIVDKLSADEASDINIKNNKVSKLAQVCVSSAIYMVNMCQTAKSSNFFFGNLCLLKAWIFGAGLVLGFSMFAGEPRKDIDDSFKNARHILNGIAATSPQATLYCDILDSFAEAIHKYHSRVSAEIHDTVQKYMSQILVFDTLQDEHLLNQSYAAEQDVPDIGIGPSFFDMPVTLDDDTMHFNQTGKDNCDTSIVVTDDFLLDIEPLERLFYSVE